MRLGGRIAAITGGTAGLGRGIAEAFLREGAQGRADGRARDKGRRSVAELGAGDRAVFRQGDVMSKEDIEGSSTAPSSTSAGSTSWSTTPAAPKPRRCVDVTDEDWDLNMKWNLYSTFYGTRRALKHMIPQQSGRIINMSSVEGKHGKAVLSGYVTAKHAINGLTKVAAKEVGTQGITVNSLCPGLVITEIVRENGPHGGEHGHDVRGDGRPVRPESAIKRPNTVEEVAAMAVLLASDAGAGITGAMLSVDGGTAAY